MHIHHSPPPKYCSLNLTLHCSLMLLTPLCHRRHSCDRLSGFYFLFLWKFLFISRSSFSLTRLLADAVNAIRGFECVWSGIVWVINLQICLFYKNFLFQNIPGDAYLAPHRSFFFLLPFAHSLPPHRKYIRSFQQHPFPNLRHC